MRNLHSFGADFLGNSRLLVHRNIPGENISSMIVTVNKFAVTVQLHMSDRTHSALFAAKLMPFDGDAKYEVQQPPHVSLLRLDGMQSVPVIGARRRVARQLTPSSLVVHGLT